MILDLFIYIIQFYINQNTFLPGFIIRKERLKLIPIEGMDLSVRSYNCLKRAGVTCLGDLMEMNLYKLLHTRNLGRKSAKEVLLKMREHGVTLSDLDDDFDVNDLSNLEIIRDKENELLNINTKFNKKDLNGYNDEWIDIKLADKKLDIQSTDSKLIFEFIFTYKGVCGNILTDFDFYITTNSGLKIKSIGYSNDVGEIPNKLDIWYDCKEHVIKIVPIFFVENQQIIEDGVKLTVVFKDVKQSYLVRKTFTVENNEWSKEELFAIQLHKLII